MRMFLTFGIIRSAFGLLMEPVAIRREYRYPPPHGAMKTDADFSFPTASHSLVHFAPKISCVQDLVME